MQVAFHLTPFPHAITEPIVELSYCRGLLDRIRDAEGWRTHQDELYQALEFGGNLAAIFDSGPGEGVFAAGRQLAERFGAPLSEEVGFGLHRQVSGQATRVHNDQPLPGHATHRVMFYLNEPGADYEGGALNVHSSRQPDAIFAAYRPRAGTMIAFEASSTSYHSVDAIQRGERVVLVLYFHHVGNCPKRMGRLRDHFEGCVAALQDRKAVAARMDEAVRARSGLWTDREQRLSRTLLRAAALLAELGLSAAAAEALALSSIAPSPGRAANASPAKAPSPAPAAAPGASPAADSPPVLLWWATRLASRLYTPFTLAKWEQDLAMLRQAPVAHEALRALLDDAYPAPVPQDGARMRKTGALRA